MDYLEIALYGDIFVLLICSVLLFRYGRLTHSHPATIYLFYHLYTFTARIISVWLGDPTLFSGWGFTYVPVTHTEIARAALMADVALISITIACVRAATLTVEENTQIHSSHDNYHANLSLAHVWRVVLITLPLGLFGLYNFARLPGVDTRVVLDLGNWQRSTWLTMTQAWVGLSLVALIYWYGGRWSLLLPLLLYFMIMMYQGHGRYRVIIPSILLVQIYLDRRRLKFPSIRIMTLLLSVAIIFFPLKTIGQMAQTGATTSDIIAESSNIIKSALSGGTDDQEFMDQFACAITLIDSAGKTYYGSTYLSLITIAVPRAVWAQKPGLVDYIGDFSRPWRPMKETGMVVTFIGEAYANFRYFGIVLIPYMLAHLLCRVYQFAYQRPYLSVGRFAYLLLACNLIQVYRDGLTSLLIFTMVNMMPLTIIVILHYIMPANSGDEGTVRSSNPASIAN